MHTWPEILRNRSYCIINCPWHGPEVSPGSQITFRHFFHLLSFQNSPLQWISHSENMFNIRKTVNLLTLIFIYSEWDMNYSFKKFRNMTNGCKFGNFDMPWKMQKRTSFCQSSKSHDFFFKFTVFHSVIHHAFKNEVYMQGLHCDTWNRNDHLVSTMLIFNIMHILIFHTGYMISVK